MKRDEIATESGTAVEKPTHALPIHRQLTGFEFHLLLRLACGQPQTEIARLLGIQLQTVCNLRSAIFEKMKFPDAAALIRYCIAHKLIGDEIP